MRGGSGPLRPARAFSNAQRTHFAFLVGVVAYIVIGELATSFPGIPIVSPEEGGLGMLRILFSALSLAAAAYTFYLNQPGYGVRRIESASEVTTESASRTLFSSHLFTLSFAQEPALMGMVLYFLNGFRFDLYLLASLSIVLMYLTRPNRARWKEILSYLASRYPEVDVNAWD